MLEVKVDMVRCKKGQLLQQITVTAFHFKKLIPAWFCLMATSTQKTEGRYTPLKLKDYKFEVMKLNLDHSRRALDKMEKIFQIWKLIEDKCESTLTPGEARFLRVVEEWERRNSPQHIDVFALTGVWGISSIIEEHERLAAKESKETRKYITPERITLPCVRPIAKRPRELALSLRIDDKALDDDVVSLDGRLKRRQLVDIMGR